MRRPPAAYSIQSQHAICDAPTAAEVDVTAFPAIDHPLSALKPVGKILLALSLIVIAPTDGLAQAIEPRFDLAIVGTAVRFVEFDPFREELRRQSSRYDLREWTELGFGARLTTRVKSILAVEGEVLFFPQYKGGAQELDYYTGWSKVAVLIGPTFSAHIGTTTLGAKVRPGLVRFGRLPAIVGRDPGPMAKFVLEVDNYPEICVALDVGGYFEFPLPKRTFIRADAGDLLIRYSPQPHELNPVFVRNNFQVSLAFGFKF